MQNSEKKIIALAVGTRPEAIKMAPLFIELQKSDFFKPLLLATGQHSQMLKQTLEAFDLTPDINLNVMTANQTLSSLTAKIISELNTSLSSLKADLVVVQGDTTTALSVALTSFYQQIPVAHLEAGLRTSNKLSPFPEEMNRRIISQIAEYHFAPTKWAMNNLHQEGIIDNVLLSGNTVIDALSMILNKVRKDRPSFSRELLERFKSGKRIILITGHRRESFGQGFEDFCNAIKILADEFLDHEFIYPVHLNPNVQEPVKRILGNSKNILLTEPLDYEPFVYLMDKCFFIISDSGGVQEEAPHLKKPVLVTRENTERPEAVEAGTAKLVGTSLQKITSNARSLILSEDAYQKMLTDQNPYGDGYASVKIREFLEKALVFVEC